MEPAKIDWKTVESVFVEDSLYEHINAPKWIDFSAPDDNIQDEVWFCRPDCKHPKTAEDFYRLSPPSKLLTMVGISDMLQLRDRTKREANLKRRQPVVDGRSADNSENNDPNLSTPPPIPCSKSVKEAFKSSADHMLPKVLESPEQQTPKLKTVRSARNLLGRDIFSHITEFCNELKKLAIRTKEKESDQEGAKSSSVTKHDDDDRMDVDEVVKTPLLGISKEKFGSGTNTGEKKNLRRKKQNDELENIPLHMDLNCTRNQDSQNSLKIRTNPPTPQCFSAARGQARVTPTHTHTSNNISASKSKFMERNILQEVKPKRMEVQEKSKTSRTESAVAEKEVKQPLDVFWFLKPCTLSEASS